MSRIFHIIDAFSIPKFISKKKWNWFHIKYCKNALQSAMATKIKLIFSKLITSSTTNWMHKIVLNLCHNKFRKVKQKKLVCSLLNTKIVVDNDREITITQKNIFWSFMSTHISHPLIFNCHTAQSGIIKYLNMMIH